mmetsp:Transcript_16858/g.25360  ORF Transcript_16858/g.25360 Transcript_16858/m.25360 type:complete len:1542 (-) Transcript_16858:189-4814(-)|eukprot:CAMPEP_0185035324 /NCGR_PEP_ID=MMETSP1103-20130426/26502_1 /TAXON_ID=36769 /ORGANISM="Paraphysomonas bandaiensis, Strain Caron Lab Isolate" /LENGTH=1541 /DNA_ID=CAMNT_0027572349 /DNA_START=54 /DNA_END=4679 /DNA_ORIENTATION=-
MSLPPPPDSPPPPDDDFDGGLGSPPGTPPDMDLPPDLDDDFDGPPGDLPPDMDMDMDGPPDDDFPPPGDEDDFPPPPDDDDDDGPPMDEEGPPMDDDMDFPPDDDVPPPEDGPDDEFGPSDLPDDMSAPPLPPDDDDSMAGPPDDASLPPPGSGPPSIGSRPPSSFGGSIPGDPPSVGPPGDDDMPPPPPPDSPSVTSTLPPPVDAPPEDDSLSELPTLPTPGGRPKTIPPRKTSARNSTNNRPSRTGLDSNTDILSEGLNLKPKDMASRSARLGQSDLGIGHLRRPSNEGSREEKSDEQSTSQSTLDSHAQEGRPLLQRKNKGKTPKKFKNVLLDGESDEENESTALKLEPIDYTTERRAPGRQSIIIDGQEFMVLQGKFEDDDFEELMVKIDKNIMYIKTAADPLALIPFDLLSDAKVRSSKSDDRKFTLTQMGSTITFQADTVDVVKELLAKVPSVAMDYSDTDSPKSREKQSDVLHDNTSGAVEDKEVSSALQPPEKDPPVKTQTPFKSFPGMNTFDFRGDYPYDDFYDYDEAMRADELGGETSDAADQKHSKPKQTKKPRITRVVGKSTLRESKVPMGDVPEYRVQKVKGYDRRELIDTHLQKPKLSVRRVKQLCKWVVSLRVWPRPVDAMSLHKEFCNGLLLARIMTAVVPGCKFLHLNERALTKKAALDNLEQALGVVWRSKCVNNFRIPTSLDIYNGNTSKIAILVQEVFEVYVLKPLYAVAPKMFKWYNAILKQYSIPLPDAIFTDGDLIDLWTHVHNGFALFCVIYHLYGAVAIGEGLDMVRIDALRVTKDTKNIMDFRANIQYVFSLLRALHVEVLWDVDDWITYPDTEFIVLQMFLVYEALKGRQCSLPPAQGTSAGVTSGPNGEPMVTGMVYADTVNTKAFKRQRRTVLLGSGEDSLPVLPIDTSGDADGYFRMVCPPGLLSNKVKIVHSSLEVKGSRAVSERKGWNSSAVVDVVQERQSGSEQLAILKQSHTIMGPRSPASPRTAQESSTTRDNAKENVDSPASKKKNALVAAMEELENAMNESQKEMDELEEELANRYIELEGLAGRLGHVEYSSRLGYLEKERMLLEEERFKMQEHFALRLQSIKDRFEEGEVFTPSPKKAPKASPFVSNLSKKKNSNNRDAVKLRQAERGWNGFSKKADTMNYALGKGRAVTSSFGMSHQQVSKWDAKINESSLNKSFKSYISHTSPQRKARTPKKNTPEDYVDHMWNSFKVKLKAETIKWASSRSSKHGNKIMELMNTKAPTVTTASPIVHTSNRIPVPTREVGGNEQRNGGNTIAEKIRQEEIRLMQFEEARRYCVIQEQMRAFKNPSPSKPTPEKEENNDEYETSTPSARSLPRATISTSSRPSVQTSSKTISFSTPLSGGRSAQHSAAHGRKTPASSGKQASATQKAVHSVKNFDAVVSWMSFPRNVLLHDRHSKRECTCVVEKEFVNGLDAYVLKWFATANAEEKKGGGHNSVDGHVILSDITSYDFSPRDSSALVLHLSSSVRALKSSGGRTVLTIGFTSEAECSKFMVGLTTVMQTN